MAVDGAVGDRWTPLRKDEPVSTHYVTMFSLGVESERADAGTGRPNLSRETEFPAGNGDTSQGKKHVFPFQLLAGHEQDWQSSPLLPALLFYVMTLHETYIMHC